MTCKKTDMPTGMRFWITDFEEKHMGRCTAPPLDSGSRSERLILYGSVKVRMDLTLMLTAARTSHGKDLYCISLSPPMISSYLPCVLHMSRLQTSSFSGNEDGKEHPQHESVTAIFFGCSCIPTLDTYALAT